MIPLEVGLQDVLNVEKGQKRMEGEEVVRDICVWVVETVFFVKRGVLFCFQSFCCFGGWWWGEPTGRNCGKKPGLVVRLCTPDSRSSLITHQHLVWFGM